MKRIPWALIMAIAGLTLSAAFLACQSDITEPTTIGAQQENDPDTWEYPAIYGYYRENNGSPIYMAKVIWVSTSGATPEVLGYCITRWDGWYRITDFTGAWEPYEGESVAGTAMHVLELYDDAYAEIQDFDPEAKTRRDFTAYPDPNQGQGNIAKNGIFEAYVKDELGNGIYPACVTIKGTDGTFLGYDTV